jgi:hypothetical protein
VFKTRSIVCYALSLNVALMVQVANPAAAQPSSVDQAAAEQQISETSSALLAYAPIFKTSGGYSTSLMFKNAGAQEATATVTLYSRDGRQIGGMTVPISPHGSARRSVSSGLMDSAAAVDGALSVQWSGSLQGVSGQVLVTDPSGSTSTYAVHGGYRFDSENTLWAPWWLPDADSDGSITLFNTSGQSLVVQSSTTANGVEKAQAPIALAPHSSEELSLRTLLSNVGSNDASAGSITFHYTGVAHALQPSLVLSNLHTGFALMPNFNAGHRQQTQEQTSWLFPYVATALDKGVSYGSGDPVAVYALMSNASAQQITPQVTAYAASKGKVHQALLPLPALGPRETRLVNLSQLAQYLISESSRMALTMNHTGQPGELGISIFSITSAGRVIAEAQGLTSPAFGAGMSYWDVSDGHSLIQQIKSATGNSESTTATLYYQSQENTDSYALPMNLNVTGDQAKTIDFTQMIYTGALDSNGKRLPQGIKSGFVVLSPANITSSTESPVCRTSCDTQTASVAQSNQNVVFGREDGAQPLCSGAPPPVCFTQLKYHSILFGEAVHTFWYIQNPSTTQYIVDGGPSCSGDCGYLTAWVTAGVPTFYSSSPTVSDSTSNGTWWGNPQATSAACVGAVAIWSYGYYWPQTKYLYEGATGPNSNSFAHGAGQNGGLDPSPPSGAVGWNYPLTE